MRPRAPLAALAAAAALAALPMSALACQGDPADDVWDENTICPEHYPADAPRFADYPARPYHGPLAAVRWRDDPAARMFRTRLQEAGRQRPNFAGRYIMAHWGCGAGCVANTLIDARSGKVFQLHGVSFNASHNVHDRLWQAGTLLRYRPDSRLFILVGQPEEDEARRGIFFYEWTGRRMKLLRHVPVGSAAGSSKALAVTSANSSAPTGSRP